MGARPPAEAAILRAHADNLDLLGHRLESVGYVSAAAALRPDVFGGLCTATAVLIEERHREQDELTGRFPENLERATRKLHRMADGGPNGNPERRPDYWAPSRRKTRKSTEDGRARSVRAGDFDALVAKFRDRTWIDPRIVLRGDAAVLQHLLGEGPLAAELRALIALLHVDHQAAAAAARRWVFIAAELREIAADLEWCLEEDLKGWRGPDHLAYQELMAHNVNGLAAVAATASMLGFAIEGAAAAVRATHEAVTGLADHLAIVETAHGLEAALADQTFGPLRAAFAIYAFALGYVRALARSMSCLRTLMGVR